MDDNSSAYTDDNGVEWVEIVTKSGGFYWTKAAELAAFLGKPYAPKKSSAPASPAVSSGEGSEKEKVSEDDSEEESSSDEGFDEEFEEVPL